MALKSWQMLGDSSNDGCGILHCENRTMSENYSENHLPLHWVLFSRYHGKTMNLFCSVLLGAWGFKKKKTLSSISHLCALQKYFEPHLFGVVFRQSVPFSASISLGYQAFLPFTDKSSLVLAQKCPQRKEWKLGRKRAWL